MAKSETGFFVCCSDIYLYIEALSPKEGVPQDRPIQLANAAAQPPIPAVSPGATHTYSMESINGISLLEYSSSRKYFLLKKPRYL
jgi:hypothetical protein